MGMSLVEELASLPVEEAEAIIDAMSAEERAMLTSWAGQARPEQQAPLGDWTYWALIAGRGAGKTRAAGEWVCDRIEAGIARYVGFIGRSAGDCRRIQVHGESGFIACAERRGMTVVEQPSRAQLVVDGEVIVMLFSAEEPDSLRGPQTDTLWGDEFAAWAPKKDPVGNTAFTNAKAGLRLGDKPQGVFSTTPRPIPEVREAIENKSGLWVVTQMATWDNQANLAPSFIAGLQEQFAGTRLAAQEFEGKFLEDVEGALWTYGSIHETRRDEAPLLPLRAIAVDPSVSRNGEGDECGIVCGGVGDDEHFYVTHDLSASLGVDAWARRVVDAFYWFGAQAVIAEVNNGGAMVEAMIHNVDPSVPVLMVRAADSKRARAEPVAQLWDQGRGHIVGEMPGLEQQLVTWSDRQKESPDRLDALVWLGHWAKERMRGAIVDVVLPGASAKARQEALVAATTTTEGRRIVSGTALAQEMLRRHQDGASVFPL